VALDGHHRLALPVSVLASFIAVWAFGFTLNTMSLLGLSLAIGILIDDAIVVRENIVRHVEMGKDHYTAAFEGTDEIGLAVAATTFSIVVVFVPIAFMGGDGGAVVRAVRADDRLLGARVAVRVVLARPDAVGLLARSARADGAARSFIARVRSTGSTTGSTGRPSATSGHRLGARPPLVDGRARARLVRRRARAAGAGVVGGGFFPVHRRLGVQRRHRDAAGLEPRLHAIKAQEVARLARQKPEVAYTYTTIGGQTDAVDEATST
jgi:hydrophobic/amphiphilic exporter-1 (mainly G- bacteria), HAE1 family